MMRLKAAVSLLITFVTACLLVQPVGAVVPTCQHTVIPVALGPGQPTNQTIDGTFCRPPDWPIGDTAAIDVLVAGATYNHLYWDWPQQPALYSYVTKTLQNGRATFNYDRIGTGQSSHPLSAQITLDADAYILHQIVNWLRANTAQTVHIHAIGHSLGSGVVMAEAASYQDVDRVVLTGILHSPGVGLTGAFASFQPALLDPLFFGSGYDIGYLTTLPGTRGRSFYASTADPNVIAYDETHKDVIAGGEFSAFGIFLLPPLVNAASHITAPVMEIAGQQDALVCSGLVDCTDAEAVYRNEAPYFPHAAQFAVYTVPATGHDLALHPSADYSFSLINTWLQNNE